MSWIVSAFLLGLLGSAHCVVMCGGISSALGGGLVRIGRKPVRSTLAYNLGRVASYIVLGAVAGVLGHAVGAIPVLADAQLVLRLCAGLVVVGAGLYVAGLWQRFALVERVGAPVWRHVRPVASRLFESSSTIAALGVGALWGLMPCGLVYAAFGLALAAGTTVHGSLVMAAFGLGTTPAMLTTGLTSARLALLIRTSVWLRRTAGAVVLVFGLIDVVSASSGLAHPSHTCCAGNH